jgi:[ribosomal protein S5]-alanine N-acetyltransferase
MQDRGLDDGVVRLRDWADDDSAWYAESVRDPPIQRFTTDSPTLDAGQVLAAIVRLRAAGDAEGYVICDAVTGERLGNVASQRAAVRAGYRRDPGRDKSQEVKGAVWPMLGYALRRPGP